MTHSIYDESQTSVTSIVYYQCCLAIAAVLVFFTRLDIYLQGIGYGVPLYWMLAFLVASVPLRLSLIGRTKDLSKLLVWVAGFIASTFTSIVIQPKLPVLQNFENQYRTINKLRSGKAIATCSRKIVV